MRADRYTKLVLTVIAVALCVIALPRLETAEVMAAPGRTGAVVAFEPQQGVTPKLAEAGPGSVIAMAPTSTRPVRWRVAWAALESNDYDAYCGTSIVVTNTTPSSVTVDVEWMSTDGGSLALRSRALAAHASKVWIVDPVSLVINNVPWYGHEVASIEDFAGYALVNADDPRIMVSAFQYCRSGTGYSGTTIVSQTNIPAYPVGATAEYFIAGMPATWTPPMVAPEVPE